MIPPCSLRVIGYRGTVTRREPIATCRWTMNCRAWWGVNASPFTNARVWSRRERTASTSRARTSSRLAPPGGRSPSRPRRPMSSSFSSPACLPPYRTIAWSFRARCRNRRRTDWARHSSFLFFNPYFFRSSFSALIRSPSHGWCGLSYFWRENFGSPNPSLLLLLLAALFLLRGLRGRDGGLLDHTDGEAGAPVAPGPLPADLLALLVANPPVAPDHLHAVDIVPESQFDVRAEQMHVVPRLPVVWAVHHPVRDELRNLPQGRLDLVRFRLREVPDPLRAGDARLVRDDLRDPDPDPFHPREGVHDGPGPLEVRVREADDVPEVLLRVRRADGRLRRGGGGLCRCRFGCLVGHRTFTVGEASSQMARSI